MKICDKCGHRNWKVAEKNPKCEECGEKLADRKLNNPVNGMSLGSSNYHRQKIIDSDDR